MRSLLLLLLSCAALLAQFQPPAVCRITGTYAQGDVLTANSTGGCVSLGVVNINPSTLDLTITQNSVASITALAAGAVANTVYISAGKVGIGGVTSLTKALTVQDASPLRLGTATSYFDFIQSSTNVWTWRGLAAGNTVIAMNNNTNAVGIGTVGPTYGLHVTTQGNNGVANFQSGVATTGHTLVNIGLGAADTAATTVFTLAGVQRFNGTNTTGAGAALLGSNSPATTNTAPYTWIQIVTSDGSTAYIPAWK